MSNEEKNRLLDTLNREMADACTCELKKTATHAVP